MRLWHQDLIPYLDRSRLLGQHRECCALRGCGWKRKHATVDYVFRYDLSHLYAYHLEVMHEMTKRGFTPDGRWYSRIYRGKNRGDVSLVEAGTWVWDRSGPSIYAEHDDTYLAECILLLKAKDAKLERQDELDEKLFRLSVENPAAVASAERKVNMEKGGRG